jgi:transglutaminase-like putative cysteine protease
MIRILKFMVLMAAIMCIPSLSAAKERQVTVTVQVDLSAPASAKEVKLWLPYPMSDKSQDVSDVIVTGNYGKTGVYRDSTFKDNALYVEWNAPQIKRLLTYSFTVHTKERTDKNLPSAEMPFSKSEFTEYLKSTSYGPTDGKVKETAELITRGKATVIAKARAIYDWIIDNMYRDQNVKGCGIGEVEKLLVSMGGKCTDIHSVYVALARSVGVPAREVFGIRIPKGKQGDMTKAQHCWAEFYLPGYGWVVVDPADVLKIILEQGITLEQAKPYREYYFGAVDENRIALSTGRDIILNPAQSKGPLNYFMYPYAEADGTPLNEDLYGFNIGFKISFKE